MRNYLLRRSPKSLVLVFFFFLHNPEVYGQANFRVYPYLQVYENGKLQITWFSNSPLTSSIKIKDTLGTEILNRTVSREEVPELYYTSQELGQAIPGLDNGSWLEGIHAYRYRLTVDRLSSGEAFEYEVTLGTETFRSDFKTAPDRDSWQTIRFVALSDSETEPVGRVTHRTWFPGVPFVRPFTIPQRWREKFGTSTEQGIEIPHYMLSERDGYAENLKIINSRNPDFMVMPGDLVQGGGYQPGWDEFFRHNAGTFDKGLTRYPIIPALGNWESFGGINGGYGFNERGAFAPVIGRGRFHAYFETPVADPFQKHRQSYYRTDYGPVTILTLDSGNGTPDQSRSDFPEEKKLIGKQYSEPGTDTQEHFTQAMYERHGGRDLSGFSPGSDQYTWLEHHLKGASKSGQLIFVQVHHIPFSSGEHGLPMNHELSSGQGGTPLRVLHPLFEKYGVIAVFAGHDELFERSFVDKDGDGKGVHYYDVGVAGDGMRGEKRDANNLLKTLDYNAYKKWTADQDSPEIWDTTGPVPLLKDGGKHYGHLEVNLEKIRESGNDYAKIRFSPVYAFPVLDANYNLTCVERRVYSDEIELKVPLVNSLTSPEFKAPFTLKLDSFGQAKVSLSDLFTTLGSFQPEEFTLSKDQFDCEDTGLQPLKITAQKTNGSGKWAGELQVNVLDTIPPTLVLKPFYIELDFNRDVALLNPEDFIATLYDNCGVAEISLDKITVSYAEAGEPINVEVTAVDKSGNKISERTQLFVSTKDLVLGVSDSTAILYNHVKIYPNPSSGLTEVEIKTGKVYPTNAIKIMDLNGKEVTSMTGISRSGATGFQLDISRLPSGAYFFLLQVNQHQYFLGKIVKR